MAKICTEAAFKNLIGKYPYLCSKGLMTPEYSRAYNLYFRAGRDALEKEYSSFTLSCEWLSKCRFLNVASGTSPKSAELCEMLGRYYKKSITNGAFIAAVLFMEVPYYRQEGSFNLHVGISKFCPSYLDVIRHNRS